MRRTVGVIARHIRRPGTAVFLFARPGTGLARRLPAVRAGAGEKGQTANSQHPQVSVAMGG
ncbi:MAG: hypothetical protein AB1327_10095 [Bacillota bacterium]|uniref:hypothetical protein n=1 Tax=Desulforudis sp. DRI-14 TaxID=3459793 RepID=UPI003471416A